jgi:AcrR family transcriptional regulator
MATKATSTRTAILDRAVDVASSDGLEGLTIGRLAGELNMSKSGLFAHFGSKEDLQLATVQAAAQRFLDDVVLPAQTAQEGAPRLRAYCEGYVDHLERSVFPGGCFWGAAAAEFDDRPGPVRDARPVRRARATPASSCSRSTPSASAPMRRTACSATRRRSSAPGRRSSACCRAERAGAWALSRSC